MNMLTRSFFSALILGTFGSSSPARATLVQILHTNDLHAALDTAGAPKPGDAEYGGWAQVKTLLDQYTRKGDADGMVTVRMDAGDFIEGTMLYFPRNGLNVLRAYNRMGFDVTTFGNHDWLMGARALNALVAPHSRKELDPSTEPFAQPLVSANIEVSRKLPYLKSQIQPYTVIERGGVKIGVFGLATTEAFYKWIPKIRSKKSDFKLKKYLDREGTADENGVREIIPGLASKAIQALRPQVDAVIALTHIGFDEDEALVQETRGMDLVVGGHSHTFLESLSIQRDPDGRLVPIVQAGYNGHSIGRIVMEVVPGQPARVLTAELIPVPAETAKDPVITAITETAHRDFVKMYGESWLNEVIGHSEVRLAPGKSGPTAFSKFSVDAIRESVGAEVGVDIGAFQANTALPGGTVTRQKLMEMYPRKFEADQNGGLSVYRVRVPGLVLALALKYAVKYGVFASFSGVDYQTTRISDEQYQKEVGKEKESDRDYVTHFRAKSIQVNGTKICLTCVYDVAAPESLVRGAYAMNPLTRLILWGGYRTDVTIWEAFESHLREIGEIRALGNDDDSARFATHFFRNSYQKKYNGRIDQNETTSPSRDASGEPDRLPALPEIPAQELLDRFIKEIFRIQKQNPVLNHDTPADSPLIEGQP